jgi:hypothetical protein
MSDFECLAGLIINDKGVSACDAGYVCFLPDARLSCSQMRTTFHPASRKRTSVLLGWIGPSCGGAGARLPTITLLLQKGNF